jgi:hypothetical protein
MYKLKMETDVHRKMIIKWDISLCEMQCSEWTAGIVRTWPGFQFAAWAETS